MVPKAGRDRLPRNKHTDLTNNNKKTGAKTERGRQAQRQGKRNQNRETGETGDCNTYRPCVTGKRAAGGGGVSEGQGVCGELGAGELAAGRGEGLASPAPL